MDEIPNPVESGVAGTQVAGVASNLPSEVMPPLHGVPMSDVIEGLAATRPRSLGAEAPAALIAAAVSDLSRDLRIAQRVAQEKDDEVRQVSRELSTARERLATLNERLGATHGTQKMKQFCIFVGTVMLSVGIDLYKSNLANLSYLVGILGAGLLFFGWRAPEVGGGK